MPRLFAALLLAALTACSSSFDLALSEPLDIDGTYRSTSSVGALGTLEMVVRKRTRSIRVFEAELSGPELAISPSEGVGTLGNDHLVLNFEIGAVDDFYFQGFVQQDGSAISGLNGSFIFPGQDEDLAVEFERTGDAPPLEDE